MLIWKATNSNCELSILNFFEVKKEPCSIGVFYYKWKETALFYLELLIKNKVYPQ